MRFKPILCKSFSLRCFPKQNLFSSHGLQPYPFRLSSSLFSQPSKKFKFNFLPTRLYCKYTDDDYCDDQFAEDVVYQDLTVDTFRKLIKTEDDEKLIKEILLMYETTKYETALVPSTLKINQMVELMDISSDSWTNLLKFYSDKERSAKLRKLQRSQKPKSATYQHLQKVKDEGKTLTMGLLFDPTTGAPLYGEWLNSHFIRLSQYEYRCSFVPNLLTSYLFGQRLIIDCDYDYNAIEAKKVVLDIVKAASTNRRSTEPFNLILTGVKSSILRDQIELNSDSLYSHDGYFGIHIVSETFMELFPKQKLVYLTEHSKKSIKRFDEDAIYIMGGLSARIPKPFSYNKSIALQIPNYCFPTELLSFRGMKNAKCFNLAETTRIMLNFKETKDPQEAVKNGISQFRLKKPEELKEEQKIRMKKLLSNMRKTKKFKPLDR